MAAPSRSFIVIVAATAGSLGIGKNGTLPWKLAADMAYFKRVTTTTTPGKVNAVIMGRKTWQSIPERFRPLNGRKNVVLSRNPAAREELLLPDGVLLAHSLSEALLILEGPPHGNGVDKIFVIGGGSVYAEAMVSELCEKVFVTSVKSEDGRFDDCDVHFPVLAPETFNLVHKSEMQEEAGIKFSFEEYHRAQHIACSTSSICNGCDVTQEEEGISGTETTENTGACMDDNNGNILGAQVSMEEHEGVDDLVRSKREADDTFAEGRSVLQEGHSEGVFSESTALKGQVRGKVNQEEGEGNEEEMQYLSLIEDILDNGVQRGDRTGTGTLSKFGVQMRFSLREARFPLLTTKRVFWRGVAEELLWFISGCTNANVLKEKDIHIWDGNGSREFLDGLGLTNREEGDLGPVYGFQWRHFGAEYTDMHADYTGKGVDQLADCINKIKTKPDDRRIILSAWNPSDLGKMALPPCHMFCQFYVANGELSCQMYQRSADMGLGVPFNIASYALLTRLIAQVCGLKSGDFVHTIGDAHVYLNHIDALREQLRRKPRPFPALHITPDKTDIDAFEFSDLELKGYLPHKSIKMKMAV